MRVLLAALLALLVLAPAQAQMDFQETHQIRIAYGDIPSTLTTEEEGVWNFQSTFLVPVDTNVTWTLPPGHVFLGGGCTDCTTTGIDGSTAPTYTTTCTSSSAGDCRVHFRHISTGRTTFGDSFEVAADTAIILYTPKGNDVAASSDAQQFPTGGTSLACTNNDGGVSPCDLRTFSPPAGAFWFVTAPGPLSTDGEVAAPADPGFAWWLLLNGMIAGAIIWYILVRQGLVQKRQRKQIAGTAVHKEVAAKESKPALEGRKRVLMAALKELEVAKMNKEMDVAVYDALKADFKKQAVTAMRALEESA